MTTNRSPEISITSLRIVCAALIGGQVLFASVVAFLRYGMETDFGAEGVPYLTTLAAAFVVAVVPVAFLLRGRKLADASGRTDPRDRMTAYAGAVILFFALLEGASLLNIVTWMVNGDLVPPVAMVVLVLAIQLASFPSASQLEDLGR